jgi:hypothetical protein
MRPTQLKGEFYTYYSGEVKSLTTHQVFVFGSNLAGIHGAGAARFAYDKFGAAYGCGMGFTGRCYAIATKDLNIETLSLHLIELQVMLFKKLAFENCQYNYIVTKIGCGLAGYTDAEIAPMFKLAPDNCIFHKDWKEYLE